MNRYERMRERKRRKRMQLLRYGGSVAVLVVLLVVCINLLLHRTGKTEASDIEDTEVVEIIEETETETETESENPLLAASEDSTSFFSGYDVLTDTGAYISSENVISSNAVLLDVDTGTVIASKDASTSISPASMTKILTLLVAVEHITDLDDTFTITQEITDYVYVNDCSSVGFSVGETVTIRDLLYGTILPSGADAALGLAIYCCGSQDAFVEKMNAKLEELGLSESAHFTNCVGLYDEDHYCTVTDMAMILKAAMEVELCQEILSTRSYTTSATTEHPEGITVSNWFLRRIEDKAVGGSVIGGKTGFVNESGSCAASYFISDSGKHYICVTVNAYSSWRCIYDQVEIYQTLTE